MAHNHTTLNANKLPLVRIVPFIEAVLKAHATTSDREVYGWLIGTQLMNFEIRIWAAIPCMKYQVQTEISAQPHYHDFQEISRMLPENLGIVGMYHSHPGRIFHSHADDLTLLKYTPFFPHMVSAVTNRFSAEQDPENQTKWFQFDAYSSEVQAIAPEKMEFDSHQFHFLDFHFIWDLHILSATTYPNPYDLIPKIVEIFHTKVNQMKLEFYKSTPLDKNKFQTLFALIQQNREITTVNSKNIRDFALTDTKHYKKMFRILQKSAEVRCSLPKTTHTIGSDPTEFTGTTEISISKDEKVLKKSTQDGNFKEYSLEIAIPITILIDNIRHARQTTEFFEQLRRICEEHTIQTITRSFFTSSPHTPTKFFIVPEKRYSFTIDTIPLSISLFPLETPHVLPQQNDTYARFLDQEKSMLLALIQRLQIINSTLQIDTLKTVISHLEQIYLLKNPNSL